MYKTNEQKIKDTMEEIEDTIKFYEEGLKSSKTTDEILVHRNVIIALKTLKVRIEGYCLN